MHFDRNGFSYTQDRTNGKLLVAQKYDPAVNWATQVDMSTGRPQLVQKYSTGQGEDVNVKGICPAALGSKDQQPSAFSPRTGLFYVPTNHVCMDYEPFQIEYVAGQPYVGATVSMFPAPGGENLGNFIAWDPAKGQIVWSLPERFSVWSGALATAGDVVFYGTLEGYLKAVDAKTGKLLFKFKTPSGIIGNINTYTHNGKQYVGRALGRRRMGRHRHGGGPEGWHRRPGCRRRLQAAVELHPAGRRADGVRLAGQHDFGLGELRFETGCLKQGT